MVPRSQIPTFGMAFGDLDDEFYMPPHLGPSVAAAATARSLATRLASNSQQPRSHSGIPAHAHRSRHARQHARRSQPQLVRQPSAPSQSGTSLESAISID
mmetsp:Transcript_41247/g.99340  ORF Transcript_41247/g.99340 Transcript_41247/m.99340 type:complete len:100 (+) Transcript_41247:178-477(+)